MKSIKLDSVWTTDRPDYACVVLTRRKYEYKTEYYYDLYRFEWIHGEPPDNRPDEEAGTRYYYLGWLDNDGQEYDDISECKGYEFLVVELLPTMNMVHEEWKKSWRAGC